jgi:hypothetical protein
MTLIVDYPWTTVQRAGARHSKTDLELIQEGHDLYSQLGSKCPVKMPWTPIPIPTYRSATVERAGARHTAAERAKIQRLHDVACELGADCPGMMTV